MASPTYSGVTLAGNPLAAASPNAFGSLVGGAPGQMTPGYTGGFDPTTISGLDPKDAGLYRFLDIMDQRAYDRELRAAELMKQQRKEEGQEAFKMKMMAAIPGQILQGFESFARLSYPAAAIEIASRTPGLIAGAYANTPYANRKWLS